MDDEGFLSADATVALLVVSFGLIIVMQAQIMALRMGRQAAAARLATAGALSVLETQWPRLGGPGSRSAADGSWTLRVTAEPGEDSAPRLCRLDVTYRAADLRRPVQVSTQRLCDAS
jgi:hypothetical protein